MGLLDGTTQQDYYQGSDHGNYQFTSLSDIINQFMAVYVGEDKIIPKAKRLDVAFHAQRALAELSFDTLKSVKAQEITLPPSLQMTLPQDYVNYTKISWVDSAGIKHLLYPASKTSNPKPILQNNDGDYALTATGTLTDNSDTVVLNGEYSNILVGMQVMAPSIPLSGNNNPATIANGFTPITVVGSTSTSGGITTITLQDEVGSGVDASWGTGTSTDSQETLTFSQTYLALAALLQPLTGLVPQEESSHIVESLTWDTTDPKILASTVASISNIKVGMLVSNDNFKQGTIVTDINGKYITTSNVATVSAAGATGEVTFISYSATSDAWSNYKSRTPSENQDDYQDDTYWPMDGSRYGLDPQHAQANGSFYIDVQSGKIHFSSNISGKTVILDYISDSLGTDGEMQVHKFAEEAMYKWISHAILAGRANIPEYQVNRFKKERFAAIRTAKLRLSSLKLEELTQILRGKSKQIKH